VSNIGNGISTIAILGGTGKEGQGLAMRWALAGYDVIIGSRLDEKAKKIAASLNEKLTVKSIIGMENTLAAQRADICILTVVQSAHQAALESLKGVLQGKILIDATARVDFRDPKPPAPPSA
jgi:NADPH-dependent F420 reductase